VNDVEIEDAMRAEFLAQGFPYLHITERLDLGESGGRSWVVSSANPDDKREIAGRAKTVGVAVSVSELEVLQNREDHQFLDLIRSRSDLASQTMRELIRLHDAAANAGGADGVA
jgi:hypothetical protein